MATKTRFVFIGAPGVGKGSFASILGSQLGLPIVGTGELVRGEIKQGTPLGEELKGFSDRGQLAPNEAVYRLVRHRLAQPDAVRGFILDGFPRSVAQALWLESAGIEIDRVVNITVPEWVTIKKMAGRRQCDKCGSAFNLADIREGGFDMPAILPDFDGCSRGPQCPRKLQRREDDDEDVMLGRLAVYAASSAPLINFYQTRGIIRNFAVRRGLSDADALVEMMMEL